jgi:hypothetical protein
MAKKPKNEFEGATNPLSNANVSMPGELANKGGMNEIHPKGDIEFVDCIICENAGLMSIDNGIVGDNK